MRERAISLASTIHPKKRTKEGGEWRGLHNLQDESIPFVMLLQRISPSIPRPDSTISFDQEQNYFPLLVIVSNLSATERQRCIIQPTGRGFSNSTQRNGYIKDCARIIHNVASGNERESGKSKAF